MLWSKLDNDIIIDPEFNALEELQPGAFWLFTRCVVYARITNYGGRICNRSRPVDAVALSRAAHRTVDDCQAFFDLSVSLGLLELEGKTYTISDWKRWHESPSDSPEAAAERKRLERARKMEALQTEADLAGPDQDHKTGVTSVTVTDVTNVTTQSRAEQSISKAKLPPPTSSTGGGEEEDLFPKEESGRDPLLQPFLNLGIIGEKQMKAIATLRGHPGALEEDVLAAAHAAVAKTQWLRLNGSEPIGRPIAYALEIARGFVPEAMERRKSNEARAKISLSTRPFVWEPPEEESACA